MYKTIPTGLLLILIFLSGCELNDGVFRKRINVMDYFQTKYDIYTDLESIADVNDVCKIDINPPTNQTAETYVANNYAQDRLEFQQQVQIESSQPQAEDPAPPPSGGASSSSSTSYSGGLFGDGEAPVATNNAAEAAANSAFSNNRSNSAVATQENPFYRITVTYIQPSEFTNITITHPTARTATLQAPGWAQVVTKPVGRSSVATYDSVAVNVKYYINQTPQGRWMCTERVVDIIDISELGQRDIPIGSRPQVVW